MGKVYGVVGNSWNVNETQAEILECQIKGDFSQKGLLSIFNRNGCFYE